MDGTWVQRRFTKDTVDPGWFATRGQVCGVERLFYQFQGALEDMHGGAQIRFSDGSVVFFDCGHDGEELAIRDYEWKDPFASPNPLISDPHDTATLAVDTNNQVTSVRRYDPYGNPRGTPTGTWPTTRGYLNQPINTTTGLTHLGAREYDQTLGRFTTVDPILDLADPNQWNPYTYANNNPITYFLNVP